MSSVYQEIVNFKLAESSKIVRFAIGLDPEEIASEITEPSDSRELGESAAKYIIHRRSEHLGSPVPAVTEGVLGNGIRDASTILHLSIREYTARTDTPISIDRALSIASHPETVNTMALLAMRPEKSVNGLDSLIGEVGTAYFLNPDATAIRASTDITPLHGGCPVAGKHISPDGDAHPTAVSPNTLAVAPTRLFGQFSTWSSVLSIHALQYRQDS